MKTKSHSISGAFVFTLLGVFAVFSMLLVVLSAQAYRTSGARLPLKTGTACRCWR